MTITNIDVVRTYADRWRSLAAWRAPLDVTVDVVPAPAHVRRRMGTAFNCQRRARIYVHADVRLADNLSTVLHELAHLAAPSFVRHARPWREVYTCAAIEALGLPESYAFELDVDIQGLDEQVTAAIDVWLTRSGQRAVLSAVGVAL